MSWIIWAVIGVVGLGIAGLFLVRRPGDPPTGIMSDQWKSENQYEKDGENLW